MRTWCPQGLVGSNPALSGHVQEKNAGKPWRQRADRTDQPEQVHGQIPVRCRRYGVIATERGRTCSCPDRRFRRICCKHIRAVEFLQTMRRAVRETVTVRGMGRAKCKFCTSPNTIRKGRRKLKHGEFQQRGCRDCGRRFTRNIGFEKERAVPEQIAMAVSLLFPGLPSRRTAKSL